MKKMSCVRLNHEGRKNKSAEGLIQARVIRLRGGLIFFAVGGGGGGGMSGRGWLGLLVMTMRLLLFFR